MHRSVRGGEIVLLFLVFLLAAINLYPIYQMIMVSFLPYTKLLSAPALGLPHGPTLANFREVLGRGPLPRFFLNSLIVATGTMLISTGLAVFGGYSLARLQYPGKALIDKTILFV